VLRKWLLIAIRAVAVGELFGLSLYIDHLKPISIEMALLKPNMICGDFSSYWV